MSVPPVAALAAVFALACGGGRGVRAPSEPTPAPADSFPLTGEAVPGMASVDAVISALMKKWEIPGGAVAIVKDGRLVYARGFGWADVQARQPAAPDALFRIASVSKPITAAAVLRLVEEGKLALDATSRRRLTRPRTRASRRSRCGSSCSTPAGGTATRASTRCSARRRRRRR